MAKSWTEDAVWRNLGLKMPYGEIDFHGEIDLWRNRLMAKSTWMAKSISIK